MEIIYLHLTDVRHTCATTLLSMVQTERQAKLRKIRSEKDMLLSLYAELIVRWRACSILGKCNKDIIINRDEMGKPHLDRHPNFQFNISHTTDALAVIISTGPVGINIEKTQKIDIGIAKRFFTESEQRYIHNATDYDRAFFEVWTQKEAYIKWVGKGLSIPLTSFSVFDDKISKKLTTKEYGMHIISCCSDIIEQINFVNINENDLISSVTKGLLPCV
jgi:4'-phosphopantetheinyl transferase